ncbi:MAG: hypothetical protein O7G85_04075 [Planctomycetota bacterium]|nr:hypothetical protein [Planctomycetota bacterium]
MRDHSVLLCLVLFGCMKSASASDTQPPDKPSNPVVVEISLDPLSEPYFDLALFSNQQEPEPDDPLSENEEEAAGEGGAEGSNPLASVSKLDFVWTLTGLSGSQTHDVSVEGATMLHPKIKLVYEVHYFFTDITGSDEDNWESIHIKPIWFPVDKKLSDEWMMRVAVGAEYIHSFDNVDQGIGFDSEIIAPLFGLAFAKPSQRLTLIPLVQHFMSFQGTSVNLTAFRLIALQSLPDSCWIKLDAKFLVDWHYETESMANEIEFGKMLNPNFGLFCTALFGVGNDRTLDWGVAVGVRFNF